MFWKWHKLLFWGKKKESRKFCYVEGERMISPTSFLPWHKADTGQEKRWKGCGFLTKDKNCDGNGAGGCAVGGSLLINPVCRSMLMPTKPFVL